MIRVGQQNTLEVVREIRGAWVLTDDGDDTVHLPSEEAPFDIQIGGDVEVFIYTDTHDVRVATTRKPLGVVGEFVCLVVVDLGRPGVFCDWGLDKDLLIPNALLHDQLRIGDKVVVYIKLDEDDRVMGVSRLHNYFDTDTDGLSEGQAVKLMIYGDTDRGFQVVVDGRWGGMLFFDQTHQDLAIGQVLDGFVTAIRDDARLDVTLRPKRQKRVVISDDMAAIVEEIQLRGGFLALTDKSSPDEIRAELSMSKKAFKRAIGGLYKARKIEMSGRGIKWIA